MDDDRKWMQRALDLAKAGWGRVHPNPMVGAVVVREGREVGEGWHVEYGGPHAEVVALAGAGEAARGATLYVTLEPCAHHGRTPPCTDAVLTAGIARVVFASPDPNPVAGGGAQLLSSHGIRVESGMLQPEEQRLNAIFHADHGGRRPFVALKLAVSLDGRLAERAGSPSVVTGEQAQAEVHRLRAGFDAILVGSTTARSDDPALTVRGATVPRVPPVRVIFDSGAGLATGATMLRDQAAPVWVMAAVGADSGRVANLVAAGARVIEVPAGARGIDPTAALDRLAREGIRSVLCEGGGRLAASLLESDRVSRVYLFVAPRFYGQAGPPAFPLERVPGSWKLSETQTVGADALLVIDRNTAE